LESFEDIECFFFEHLRTLNVDHAFSKGWLICLEPKPLPELLSKRAIKDNVFTCFILKAADFTD